MVWAPISWHSLGPLPILDGCVTAKDYQTFLDIHMDPSVQTLVPCIRTTMHHYTYKEWWFDELESKHLKWATRSLDLNVIETLWGVLEEHQRPGHSSARRIAQSPSGHCAGLVSVQDKLMLHWSQKEALHHTSKLLRSEIRCFSFIVTFYIDCYRYCFRSACVILISTCC